MKTPAEIERKRVLERMKLYDLLPAIDHRLEQSLIRSESNKTAEVFTEAELPQAVHSEFTRRLRCAGWFVDVVSQAGEYGATDWLVRMEAAT
jgi:hypothetical protein